MVDTEGKLQVSTRHRFPKGKDWNGNRNGPPRKPEIELLRNAIEAAKKKTGKHILVHLVERAYINDQVLIALAKKIVPDKLEGAGFGDMRIVVVRSPQLNDRNQDTT